MKIPAPCKKAMSNFKTNERSTEAVSRALLSVLGDENRFYYKILAKLEKLAGKARYMLCLD